MTEYSEQRDPSLDYEDEYFYVRHDGGNAWRVYRSGVLISIMWGSRDDAIARGKNPDDRDYGEIHHAHHRSFLRDRASVGGTAAAELAAMPEAPPSRKRRKSMEAD